MTAADLVAQFRDAIADAGLPVPEKIVADGQIQRYSTNGRASDDSGWYCLYLDGLPAGAFGCWRTGTKGQWHAELGDEAPTTLTAKKRAHRKRMAELRRKRDDERARRHSEAATKAAEQWAQTEPATEHAYLMRKGVRAHGLRVDGDRLLIPMRDSAGKLWNLQRIDDNGEKRFMFGARVTGCYHSIGEPRGVLYVAEGYATGASVYEATGDAVAVAFNAGNLEPVAQALREKFTEVRIVIAGDNDESRTGQREAGKAARAIAGETAIPDMRGDWNDVHAQGGLKAVREGIERSQRKARKGHETVSLDDFRAHMPDHRYIFRPTRDLWPASSIDARLPWPKGPDNKPMRPSRWLDENHPVEQMTWAPGEPELIEGRLIDGGGWIEHAACTTFNLYRPPTIGKGNPDEADLWLEHLARIYGVDDATHIVQWLAQRVQQPGVKINHALVLGGKQGIGKDTILEPVKYAVGPWNFSEVSPQALLGRFNPFVKSVILRVSEARDLGELDRFTFYDHMKTYTAAPPDVLVCDEKNIREHSVLNVCGVIITTNHKSDGIYLPADDRRHYVAWSEVDRSEFDERYWTELWRWYANGGIENVAAYLATLDLSGFDSKAPPPKTDAFWHIVNAARAPEETELADVLDALGYPEAITLELLEQQARIRHESFADWLRDRRNRRQIPHRLEAAGYEPVRNDVSKDGLFRIGGKRQAVYARTDLTLRDRITAATDLTRIRR